MTEESPTLSPASLWGCNKVTLCWTRYCTLVCLSFHLSLIFLLFSCFPGEYFQANLFYINSHLRVWGTHVPTEGCKWRTDIFVGINWTESHSFLPPFFVYISMLSTGFFCFLNFFFWNLKLSYALGL